MFLNDNELKKYFYLISYAGIILAIILNLSSVFSFIHFNLFRYNSTPLSVFSDFL